VKRFLAWLSEWVRKVGLNAPYWGGISVSRWLGRRDR
jgi:hypothetical protein